MVFSTRMRDAGNMAIKTFCLASFVYNLAFLQIPIIMPLVFADQHLPAVVKGFLQALCYLTAAAAIPFINSYLSRFGVENSLLLSNVVYVAATVLLGIGLDAPDINVIVPCSIVATSLMGFFISVQLTAEGVLVLKYSEKVDREKNIGLLRGAQGIGLLIAPCVFALSRFFSDYWGSFVICAVMLAVITPYTNSNMLHAKTLYEQELELLVA